jgi:hypothetical protein
MTLEMTAWRAKGRLQKKDTSNHGIQNVSQLFDLSPRICDFELAANSMHAPWSALLPQTIATASFLLFVCQFPTTRKLKSAQVEDSGIMIQKVPRRAGA